MLRTVGLTLGMLGMVAACGGDPDSETRSNSSGGAGGATAGGTGANGSGGDSGGAPLAPAHDFCADLGDDLGMGVAIFGDPGTAWVEAAATSPTNVDWTFGYFYASGDPHEDVEGFEWLANYRLDTAESAGAAIPTVTFYRMLSVGRDHGHSGSEAQVVQSMLTDADALRDYLDDLVAVLEILGARSTPPLLHVEPDSWGFMMWAFDGFDGVEGNSDATAVPVSLTAANHPALGASEFADDAGGLGRAMLYLRDQIAPNVRMGWHASNFRVGTRPEVVTAFYASMGAWDVIVTEPPHMNGDGSSAWDTTVPDNANNLDWLATVSSTTNLPILVWQTYVESAAAYLGSWPGDQRNLAALAAAGVAGVLWDPNGNGGDCAYACAEATALLDGLSAYSAAPLALPAGHVCMR